MALNAKYSTTYANRKHRRVISEINVTPFVDVMLVLLIIFMISAPLMVHGVKVNLPKNSAAPTVETNPFNLTINANGEIYYDQQKIELEQLEVFLRNNLLSFNAKIYLRGDRDISYGSVMKIIEEINKAGYSKVALVTNNS